MTVVFVNSVVVGEGDGFAEFVVGLDAPASKPVSLTFLATAQGLGLLRLMSHGIADEADTEGAAASLVFSPGETRKTVRVPIVDDDLAEGAEQFMLTLTLMPQSVIDGVQLRVRSGYALIHDNDGPAANATVAVDDVIVDEKDGVARFVVRLGDLANGGTAHGEVRVGYRTVDGGAIAGQDYTATSGTLEFAPGRNIAVVEVPIADDALSEGVERFTLELTEASGGASLLDAVAVGEIGLSDGTVVSQPLLSIDPLVVSEGERFADLTLRLSAPAFDPIGVTFGILASQPTLEFLPPGDLAFAPGQTTLTVRLPLTQDGRDLVPTLPGKVGDWQGPLLAARSVTPPQQYMPGSALLTLSPAIVVLSNDTLVTTPTVFVDDIVVDEKRGQAVFVLRLGRHDGEASAQPVWVDFTTRDGSAVAGADYVAASGRAVFEPGESVARVAIDLIDDALAEASETFELVLGSAHGAVLGDSAAAAEIALSDGTPLSRPLISAADLVVDESVGMGMLVVRLSAPSPNVVTLNYKIESPEREGGEAFMAMAGVLGSSLVFAPGETVHSVPFVIVDDDAIEAVEQFDVVLSGAGNGTLVRQVVHVQVRDNDRIEALPALRVEAPTVDEGAAAAQFVVSLGAHGGESADHPVTVHWHTVDGSASAGQDYVGASGTLRFEPGESVKTVPVALIDDASAESAERFSLVLEAPEGALLLTPSAAATIAASDAGMLTQPRLSIEGAVVSERDQFVDLLVKLDAPSNVPQDFTLSLARGTTDIADYRDLRPTVYTFAPGETVRTVRVTLVDDGKPEREEHFVVNAIPVAGGAQSGNTAAVVTLVDNDAAVELPQVFVRDAFIDESAGLAHFVVQLGRGQADSSNGIIELHWATADGTALAGRDYVAAAGVLRFAPGESVQTVSVEIVDDSWREPIERFALVLSGAQGATIADGHALGLIGASDAAAVARPTLSTTATRVAEGDGWIELVTMLDAPAAALVSAGPYFTTSDADAVNGTDYRQLLTSVSFAPGQTLQTLRLSIGDDTVLEGDEAVKLNLVPTQGQVATTAAVTIGFVDDDDLSRNVFSYGRSDDDYRPQSAADIIVEGADGGSDTVYVTWSLTLPEHVENAVLEGDVALALSGNAGMNVLSGNSAANRLDGGDGIDTAVFAATRSAATVTGGAGSFNVSSALDGSDTLVSIERLRFADLLRASDTSPGDHTWLAYAMFNAAFNRGPDTSELGRWTAQLDMLGNARDLAQAMINFYAPGVPDDVFVEHLWATVVGTPIPVAERSNFVGQLQRGELTQAALLELAATYPLNTNELVAIVGQPLDLEVSFFVPAG